MHDARGAFTLWVTATYLLCRSTWMLISSLGLWIYLNGMAFVKRQHLAAHEYRCIRCQSLYFLYTQIRHFLSLYLFATTRCVCFQMLSPLATFHITCNPLTSKAAIHMNRRVLMSKNSIDKHYWLFTLYVLYNLLNQSMATKYALCLLPILYRMSVTVNMSFHSIWTL